MQTTPPLAADLGLLTAALYDPTDDPTTDVAQTVLVFATNARLTVQSFVGLTLTITIAGHAGGAEPAILRFTLLEDHVDRSGIKTSLRLPGSSEGVGPDELSIQVVLYAATPGAFVDMAADLAFLTSGEFDTADLDQHLGLAHEPDITGVIRAETVIGEAVGVLIAGGSTREQAHAELDTLANAATTDRVTEASRILTTRTRDGPEPREPVQPTCDTTP